MNEHLLKRKRAGIIDFIKVPLNWGRSHSEFVGYDLQNKYFFRIFFDNKYREDKIDALKRIERLEYEMKEYSNGGFGIGRGFFSTKGYYDDCEKELNFYKKYLEQK